MWSSAVTDNQIVAFLYGMVLSFLLFAGFDFIGEVGGLAEYQSFLLNLGINYHVSTTAAYAQTKYNVYH